MYSDKWYRGPVKTLDQFVCRLQQKAQSCDLSNLEEAICDQVIDKCQLTSAPGEIIL